MSVNNLFSFIAWKMNKLKRRMVFISKSDRKKIDEFKKGYPNVLSTTETLDAIIEQGKSICRYGDAEFDICQNIDKTDAWQRGSRELTERLKEILECNDKNILVCIPPFNSEYNNIKKYYGKLSFWEYYWLFRYEELRPLLKKQVYGNSFVSRDAVFYENDLERIKQIWHDKKVVFVYGKGGRFEISDVLFDNIKQREKVLIPPTNAFDRYEDILEQCMNFEMDWLFLISAGPTATVLAYDLAKNGYQALDIGHLPNCYAQYKGIISSPESLPTVR